MNDLHPIPDGFEEVSAPADAAWEPQGLPQPLAPPTPEVRARAEKRAGDGMKPSAEDPRLKLYDIPDGFEEIQPEQPGVIESAIGGASHGLAKGLTAARRGMEIVGEGTFAGQQPEPADRSQIGQMLSRPLAQGWSDPSWWAAQLAGGAAESAPALSMGALGGALGGPLGGAAGFGLGAALQALKSSYALGRAQGLSHDDATTQAILESGISGIGGASAAAAPGVSVFGQDAVGALRRPVGEALAQFFGIQPGIMAGQRAAENLVEGQPLGEGVPEAAVMGAAQGVPLMAGHALGRGLPQIGLPEIPEALRRGLTKTIPEPPGENPFTYSRGPDQPWEPPMGGGGGPELPPPPFGGSDHAAYEAERRREMARRGIPYQEFETLPTPGIPGPQHGEQPRLPAPEAPTGGAPTVSPVQENYGHTVGETATPQLGAEQRPGLPAPAPGKPIRLKGPEQERPPIELGPPRAEEPAAVQTAEPEKVTQPGAISSPHQEPAAAAEEPAPAPKVEAETTFQTAKGSTYQVHGDGTTTRAKAPRADVGHEGDQGVKPRTAKTVYVSPDDMNRLATPQGNWRVIDHGDGTLSVATKTRDGQWGIAPSARNVPVSAEPMVGAHPVELWKPEQINDLTGYGKVHFGNAITALGAREHGHGQINVGNVAAEEQAPRPAPKVEAETPPPPQQAEAPAPKITIQQVDKVTKKFAGKDPVKGIHLGEYRAIGVRERPWATADAYGKTPQEAEANVRRALGEKVEAAAKGRSGARLKDFGTEPISGGYEGESAGEGSRKKEFLRDASRFLGDVALELQKRGFARHTDRKGRPDKPVSIEPAGPAVAGDVTLTLTHPESGVNVYATIGHGVMGRGTHIMVRSSRKPGDKFATNGTSNEWLKPTKTVGEIAEKLASFTGATPAQKAEEPPAKPQSAPEPRLPIFESGSAYTPPPWRDVGNGFKIREFYSRNNGVLTRHQEIQEPQSGILSRGIDEKGEEKWFEVEGFGNPFDRDNPGAPGAVEQRIRDFISGRKSAPKIDSAPEPQFRPASKTEIDEAKFERKQREAEARRISPEAQKAALERTDRAGVTDAILDRIADGATPAEAAEELWLDDSFWDKNRRFEFGYEQGSFADLVENVARAKKVPVDDLERMERWRDYWASRDQPDLFKIEPANAEAINRTDATTWQILTERPAFKEWFSGSKVVDKDGRPLRVYHGTAADFEKFDKGSRGSNTRDADAFKAFFFTSDHAVASEYAEEAGASANVYPAFLSLKNPLIIDRKGGNYHTSTFSVLLDKAKEDGYDGVIFKNVNDTKYVHGYPSDTYAVFEPDQIMSAISGLRDEADKLQLDTFKSILSDPEQRAAVEAVIPEIADVVEGQIAAGEAGEGDRGAEPAGARDDQPGEAGGDLGQRPKPADLAENAQARGADQGAEAAGVGERIPLHGADGSTLTIETPAQKIADFLLNDGKLTKKRVAGLTGWNLRDRRALKEYEEGIELGVVLASREIVNFVHADDKEAAFSRLVKLYDDMPILSARTSTSIANQAYSTPAPLAFAAAAMADIGQNDDLFEPTAGNGMLAMTAKAENVVANEIDKTRRAGLDAQGFKVMDRDATAADIGRVAEQMNSGFNFNRVIANPPFGNLKDANGKNRIFDLSRFQDGYETREIDHVIALNALAAMSDNGKAALILGGLNKLETDRTGGYGKSKAKREFYLHLYNKYNVVDHFTASGDLYAKQGAAWPVDVIIIHGRGKSPLPYPFVSAPSVLSSWDEIGARLKDKLDEYQGATGKDRQEGADAGQKPSGERPGGTGDRTEGHAAPSQRGANAAGERAAERPGEVHPGGAGAESGDRGRARAEPDYNGGAGSGEPRGSGGEPDASVSVGTELTVAGARQDHVKTKAEPEPPPFEEPPPENESEPSFLRAFTAEQRGRWNAHQNQSNKDIALSLGKRLDVMRANPEARPDFVKRLKEKLDGILYAIMGPEPSAAASGGRGSWSDFSAKAQSERARRRNAWEQYRRDAEQAQREKEKERAERKERQKSERKARPEQEAPEKPPEPEKRDTETEGQAAYTAGASYARGLGTLVPKNMRDVTQAALDALKARIEEPTLDEYVANKIGMDAHDPKWPQRFSGEQVDALALAIDNLEHGSGFIIGDQTGVGKGRVNAGIMLYALQKGKTPVFVTEKPNLYADIYRDLKAIGVDDYLGRPLRMMMTNATGSFPLDDDATVILKPEKKGVIEKALASASLPDHDILVTTYDQMNPVATKDYPDGHNERRQLLQALAPNAQFLFDEAHNVGEEKERVGKKNVGKATLRGKFFRDLVASTRGVFYSSATYAKRPSNMDFYSATDMRHAVDDPKNLGEAISKGGVPMQEVVAAMLAKSGQYIRRERSFHGVTFDTVKTQVDKDQITGFSRGLRAVYEFSDIVEDIIKQKDRDEKKEGKMATGGKSTGGAGVSSTHFSALMHNLIGQMLLAQKANHTADMAIEAIRNGQRPVIALTNTMTSFLQEFMEASGSRIGDPATLSFNDLMLRYLDRTRRYTVRKPFSSESEQKYLSDQDLGPVGLALFNKAKKEIEGINLGKLPISPIDYMRERIERAGFKTAEITARSVRIDYSSPIPVLAVRGSDERGTKGRLSAIKGFNSGVINAVVINAAGSTGLSIHDDANFRKKWPKGAGQRVMFIVQANPDINVFMQTLGRIHRTGQVTLPAFKQVIADAPAEIRIASVLQQKMASLNANTTASKDSSLSASDVPDFLNEHGDYVAMQAMEEDPELHAMLGRPLDDMSEEGGGEMRKLTGHISMLDYDDQVRLMEDLVAKYNDRIAALEAAGENIASGKALDLDARKIGGITVVQKKGKSPFQDAVHLGEYDVKSAKIPIRFAKVKEAMASELQIDLADLPEDPDAGMRKIIDAGQKRTQGFFDAANNRFNEYKREIIAKRTDPEAAEKMEAMLAANKDAVTNALRILFVGNRVKLSLSDGSDVSGYVSSLKRDGKSNNPFAASDWKASFAIPGQGILTFPLSQLRRLSADMEGNEDAWRHSRAIVISPADYEKHAATAERFDSFKEGMREKRLIATGNLLAAYDFLNNRGQIVQFTMDDGRIEQGILAPKEMQSAEQTAKEKGQKANSGREIVEFITKNNNIDSEDKVIRIFRYRGYVQISIEAAKATGGKYFLNEAVRAAAHEDFVKSGNRMVLEANNDAHAASIIDALIRAGASFRVEFTGG